MDASLPPLPPELRDALNAQGGSPLYIRDEETQKVYSLMEEPADFVMDDDYIREMIREADEDIAAGRVEPWEVDSIKREGRRLLAERQARKTS